MKLATRIKRQLLSTQGQKISLAILLVAIFFFAPTFAQETTKPNALRTNTEDVIQKILNFFSRSWIVLATLAGKFMTNDMIYGSRLHMDIYLWKLRNICKNFANFGVLGILLREIIQFITKKSGSIQSIVGKALIAGILIQASWFLLAALIDISTIITAAVSTFPVQFLDSNSMSKSIIIKEIESSMQNHILKLDKEGNASWEESTDNTTKAEDLLAKIMPDTDSVSGPLVYIGAATLRIQDAIHLKTGEDTDAKKIVTSSLLQLLMIGLFCITLILLIVANIIRIGLLRVIIPLSPILVLMFTMGKSGKSGIAKNFDIGVILSAIFKPAVFAGALSVILIFIVSMQNIMTSDNTKITNIQGTTFTIKGNVATMDVNNLSTTTINDKIFTQIGNTSKGIFSNLIIYFATIFLLRYLVKVAVKSGGGTIGETMGGLTDLTEKMAKTTPIIGGYSLGAYQEGRAKSLQAIGKGFGIDLNSNSSSFGKLDADRQFQEKLNKYIYGQNIRNESDFTTLGKTRDINGFLDATKTITNQKGISPLSYSRDPETYKRRETMFNEKGKNRDEKYFTTKSEKTIAKLNEEGLKALHVGLGGTPETAPKTYDDFKKQSYGTNEQEASE